MNNIDLIVLVLYLIGLVAMGSVFARMKNTREMFAAGGESPWWLSGLSGFMTTFSAGTFVVWGGIAYRYGFVSVSILVVIGFASILIGMTFASRWKNFGYDSAAEFLDARFGKSIVQLYTWLQGLIGIFTMGGGIYALAVMVTALMPLPPGHVLADPATGHFSVNLASVILCGLVVVITSGGGLWAVLMTDALQFIILLASVLVVVPLVLMKLGGTTAFLESLPAGFTSPVAAEFNSVFLVGWGIVYFIKMGGEWAYVQRFACVPSPKDARKSSYLFGILYIITPVIWMLPAMAYRVMDPSADHEQAYILACQAVLPAGMLGLMIAAMCSATTSTATTLLNVYAGAFTTEFYQRLFRPQATQRELVVVGRLITVLLGVVVMAGALLIPYMGTYTGYVLASVTILSGPLILPTLWGLYSRKIGLKAAWTVTVAGAMIGLFIKLGFQSGGWFENVSVFASFSGIVQINERITDLVVGIVLPLVLLCIEELRSRQTYPGWERVAAHREAHVEKSTVAPSKLPGRLFGWSILIVSIVMAILTWVNDQDKMITGAFSAILFVVGLCITIASQPKSVLNSRWLNWKNTG